VIKVAFKEVWNRLDTRSGRHREETWGIWTTQGHASCFWWSL